MASAMMKMPSIWVGIHLLGVVVFLAVSTFSRIGVSASFQSIESLMNFSMLGVVFAENKILGPVVGLVLIYMMNKRSVSDWLSKNFFHNENVFAHVTFRIRSWVAWAQNHHVSTLCGFTSVPSAASIRSMPMPPQPAAFFLLRGFPASAFAKFHVVSKEKPRRMGTEAVPKNQRWSHTQRLQLYHEGGHMKGKMISPSKGDTALKGDV